MDQITKSSLLEFALSTDGVKLLHEKTTPCLELEPYPIDNIVKAVEYVNDPENKAAGLAAPQIGDGQSWFVMKKRDGSILIVVNPTIVGKMGQKQYIEGCFSEENPARVKRAKTITAKFTRIVLSKDGFVAYPPIFYTFDGVDAQVFQHEYSHLQGRLLSTEGTPIELPK
jgi:peptide deformylase